MSHRSIRTQVKSLTRIYQARIDANVELLVWLREFDDGEQEIVEVLDIVGGLEEFDNVREV